MLDARITVKHGKSINPPKVANKLLHLLVEARNLEIRRRRRKPLEAGKKLAGEEEDGEWAD